jgi:hypothetical protein
MNLPKITPKQQEILNLIYTYRFIARKQLQILLGHTDKRRVSSWLKELREQQFIDWIYDPLDPNERSTPAIYFLCLNGIRFLRQTKQYTEADLRKRYKDNERQQDFIAKCLLLVDCTIHLHARNMASEETNEGVQYAYALEADYANPDHDYNLVAESEYIHPDLIFTKTIEDDATTAQAYLMQLFDPTTPRYMVKKKLKGYVEYFDSNEPETWQEQTEQEELPIVLIACPTLTGLIYAKRYTKKQLEEHGLVDREDVHIRFATIEQVKRQGMTSMIWEEV